MKNKCPFCGSKETWEYEGELACNNCGFGTPLTEEESTLAELGLLGYGTDCQKIIDWV